MSEAIWTEKRGSLRRRTLKGGHIVFNGHSSTIDCTVRNISDSGAKLIVASVIGLPERFELAMAGQPGRACRIARRTLTEVGVSFEQA
jgi:hypothetical protein